MLNTDESDSVDPAREDLKDDLTRRLTDLWQLADRTAFYGAVQAELSPLIHRHLRRSYIRLSDADVEDCISSTLEAFWRRSTGKPIENPGGYIWTSAIKRARRLGKLQAQRRERPLPEDPRDLGVDPATDDGASEDQGWTGDVFTAPRRSALAEDDRRMWTAELAESLLPSEVDVEPTWVEQVFSIAVSRLPKAQQRVVKHLLVFGPDYNASDSPSELGMRPMTFRGNKSRAFERLRLEVPKVMKELGIEPRQIAIELGLVEPSSFPSLEDDDGTATG